MRRRKKRKQVEDGTSIVWLHTALASDYFLLKTLWEPGIVDCRESLSLFHLVSPLLDWSGTFWLLGVVGGLGFCFGLLCVFGSWPFLLTSLSNNDNLAQLNDCHSCNDARSIVQKNWNYQGFLILMLHAPHNDLSYIIVYHSAWGVKRPWRRASPPASSSSISTGACAGKRPCASCTNLTSPTNRRTLQLLLPSGSARRDESTSDSDPKWSPYILVLCRLLPWIDPKAISLFSCSPTGCCHGKIQSDPPDPSLLKRARAPSEGLLLAFSRSPLGSLLAGFLLLFLILDDVHLSSIPGSPRLVGLLAVLLLRHLLVLLHLLSGWASLHPGLEGERKLRGFWGGCDGKFHLFHQVLGWSSCLRSATNRHAVVRLGRIVSPDLRCHFVVSSCSYECITTSIAFSTRTNALSVCGISKPPWHFCNGRVRRH